MQLRSDIRYYDDQMCRINRAIVEMADSKLTKPMLEGMKIQDLSALIVDYRLVKKELEQLDGAVLSFFCRQQPPLPEVDWLSFAENRVREDMNMLIVSPISSDTFQSLLSFQKIFSDLTAQRIYLQNVYFQKMHLLKCSLEWLMDDYFFDLGVANLIFPVSQDCRPRPTVVWPNSHISSGELLTMLEIATPIIQRMKSFFRLNGYVSGLPFWWDFDSTMGNTVIFERIFMDRIDHLITTTNLEKICDDEASLVKFLHPKSTERIRREKFNHANKYLLKERLTKIQTSSK